MEKNKINYNLVNILLLMIIIYIAVSTMDVWGGILKTLFIVILPFLVAFGIAYALYPIVRFLEKKGVRKFLAVSIVVISAILIIVSLLSVTLPLLYEQLISFSKLIMEAIHDLSLKFDIDLGGFQVTITDTLNSIIKDLGRFVSTGTFDLLNKSIGFITNFIIILIVSIYFLADMDKIRKNIKAFLKKFKNKSYRFVKTLDSEIGKYLNGLMLFILIQLIEYCLVFRIINHPNWLLLGILASVTTIIPYFGGLFTNIIAVITASVISTPLFVLTLIVCLVFPNIDGYIISPKIYGKTNNINPILSIFAVMAGGTIGGFLGIVVALPVLIILTATYRFFKKDIIKKYEAVKESI